MFQAPSIWGQTQYPGTRKRRQLTVCWEAMAWCDEGNEMALEEVMVRVVLAQRWRRPRQSHWSM